MSGGAPRNSIWGRRLRIPAFRRYTWSGMSLSDRLLKLFYVDSQVRGLRSRVDSARRYLSAQERQLLNLSRDFDEIEARRRHVQATIGNLEGEIASIDERIEKLRDELNAAVTNKQYSAVLSELNTVKARRSEIETRVLEEMETVDELNERLETIRTQVAEREKVRQVAQEELRERESEVGHRLAELEGERDVAAAEIPAQHLVVFEEMARDTDGETMASIDEIDRRHRDYACGTCHMTVPFEQVSLLLSGGDVLVRCTACGRILYIANETRETLAGKK